MNMILFLAAGAVAYLVKPYFGDLAANHFTNQNHGKTSVINPQDFTFFIAGDKSPLKLRLEL